MPLDDSQNNKKNFRPVDKISSIDQIPPLPPRKKPLNLESAGRLVQRPNKPEFLPRGDSVITSPVPLAPNKTNEVTKEAAHIMPENIKTTDRVVGMRVEYGVLLVGVPDELSPGEYSALEDEIGMPINIEVLGENTYKRYKVIEEQFKKEPISVTEKILNTAIAEDATDILLGVGRLPRIRIAGDLLQVDNNDFLPLSATDIEEIFRFLNIEGMGDNKTINFAANYLNKRLRCSAYYQREKLAIAIRILSSHIPSFKELGLPVQLQDFSNLDNGLILFVGTTGSGKSTSIASLIDIVNQTRPCHIITIEDPIEYIHPSYHAVIDQREVGIDVNDFHTGIVDSLRQDPDIILVGEIRSVPEVEAAIRAAETGHLVFATLHSSSAASSIDRILDLFPPEKRQQIQIMLSQNLAGVVVQQLVKLKTHQRRRRVIAEIMIPTPAIRNHIKNGETNKITNQMISEGREKGNILFADAFTSAVRNGDIDASVAVHRVPQEQLELFNKNIINVIPKENT